ncbi:ubiquitin-protein ligase-like protein [Phyllosticta citribraziliensis]|uniref:Ubiquitin-protein ligase-like protein n=1 Tax=Phyllosticta citribraziliensis TaxID=989973 RepID=A0ABR1LUR6_9PEZI
MDILGALPQAATAARRVGQIAMYPLEQLDGMFGKAITGGSVIAEATTSIAANVTRNITSSSSSSVGKFIQSASAIPGPGASAAAATSGRSVDGSEGYFSLDSLWRFGKAGGVFAYLSSRWALATFTVAILLNRTQFYASSRIPLHFNWRVRLAVYLPSVLVLLYQAQCLLQALRCQTSPQWSKLRYHDAKQPLAVDMAGEGGLVYKVASTLLYWEDDLASCSAVNMASTEAEFLSLSGSLARLWPLFLSLCFSQFVETLSCALQGRRPMPETGMTIFEHSLAYSETEAMLTKPFDLGTSTASITRSDGMSLKLSRSMLLQILNVPPEVIIMSLVSCLGHLSSNVLAILNMRSRFRLVNTGIWALAYMAVFTWAFIRMTNILDSTANESGSISDLGFLRVPTVCIVGFLPHLLIVLGVAACGIIYGLALVLTALSMQSQPGQSMSIKERFTAAHGNLQANVHFSGSTPISINWRDDFYTAMLKVGFTVLTAASEAVFLNEGTRIRVSEMTWLEEKRIKELSRFRSLHQRTVDTIPLEIREDFVAEGVKSNDVLHDDNSLRSGYARERKTRGQKTLPEASSAHSGVGLLQRRGRWVMTFEFIKGIHVLLASIQARLLISLFEKVGIAFRPMWLVSLAGGESVIRKTPEAQQTEGSQFRQLDFWYLKPDGSLTTPSNSEVDVETETRRRLEYNGQKYFREEVTEEGLNSQLYSWWKNGGWWGELDNSGDYEPSIAPSDADDATSVISTTTQGSNDDQDWSDVDADSSGRRTPTQADYSRQLTPFTRESTPFADNPIDPSHLARLLDPKTEDDRNDAQLLASHLRSTGVMTRAQYRKSVERDRARLLTSSHGYRSSAAATAMAQGEGYPSPEAEERALEHFILERRNSKLQHQQQRQHMGGSSGDWESGAEGMGSGGPQCVVCQASPRTILVWPCGCLSLCDECRLGLATRNFDKCVCCRSDVAAYSRLYVP